MKQSSPALVFGRLLLRGLVDLVLASSRSLGCATWSCPAASWTDPQVNLARGAASAALALQHGA